jgi:hypothetical protein
MLITLSKCTIEIEDQPVPFVGRPMDTSSVSEGDQEGLVTMFRVNTSDELDIQYGIVSWPEANREVTLIEWHSGDTKYDSLKKGTGRLALSPVGANEVFQLRAMKYNDDSKKANLANVTLEDLGIWVQADLSELLMRHGAIQVGSKGQLTGEENKTKSILSALVPKGNVEAVAIAFTVTRVLAIMYDYGLDSN